MMDENNMDEEDEINNKDDENENNENGYDDEDLYKIDKPFFKYFYYEDSHPISSDILKLLEDEKYEEIMFRNINFNHPGGARLERAPPYPWGFWGSRRHPLLIIYLVI